MQCMNSSEWNIHLVSWWKKVEKKIERNHCKMGGLFFVLL